MSSTPRSPRSACMLSLSLLTLAAANTVHASEPAREAHPTHSCESLEATVMRAADPSVRVSLAECYAQLGRTASAWAQYREAAASARTAGDADIEAAARRHAKALEDQLSYVTVQTWKGQEVIVTRDGTPIEDAVLGTAIPLDPGSHVITASAPGKRGWTKRIELGSHGDHVTVSVPVLPDDVSLAPDLRAAPALPPEPVKQATFDSVQRTLGLVAGALGIAGVATGTLFGVKAASDWSEAKAQCTAFPYCGEDGARLAKEAKTSALISTLGFATGIAGLSGGALLWFTAPRAHEQTGAPTTTPATTIGVGVGNVQVRGSL